jgi:hypothetical protein
MNDINKEPSSANRDEERSKKESSGVGTDNSMEDYEILKEHDQQKKDNDISDKNVDAGFEPKQNLRKKFTMANIT